MGILDATEEERRRAEEDALAQAVAEQAAGHGDVRLPERTGMAFPKYREPPPVVADGPDLTPGAAPRKRVSFSGFGTRTERPMDPPIPPPEDAAPPAPIARALGTGRLDSPAPTPAPMPDAPPSPIVGRLSASANALASAKPPSGGGADMPRPPGPDSVPSIFDAVTPEPQDAPPESRTAPAMTVTRRDTTTASAPPAGSASTRDWSAAEEGARAAGRDLSASGPVERFLQNWGSSMTQGRVKANFGEANRLDAQALRPIGDVRKAEATAKADDLAALQKQLLLAQTAKAQRPDVPKAPTLTGDAATLDYLKKNPDAKDLVPVIHPPPAPKAAKVLTDAEVRKQNADADFAEWKAKNPNAGAEETERHHRRMENRPVGGAPAPGTSMTDNEIEFWAAEGVLHNIKPNLPRNSPELLRIAKATPEWVRLNNVDPGEARAKYAGLTKAMGGVEAGAAKTNAYEGAADGAMTILENVSAKVPRMGLEPLDALLVKGASMLPGKAGENAKNLRNSTETLANEYARVMNGLNGVTSDQARAHAQEMLASGLSDGTMKAVMAQFRQEFKARNEGNEKELARISGEIKAMHPSSRAVHVLDEDGKSMDIPAARVDDALRENPKWRRADG